jgi:murein DD-endopeptidase MepM/ murein hydrolase activator NlpD
MEGNALPARRWLAGAALIAVGITAGCSIYRPLDRGSHVPWAQDEVATPAALKRGGIAVSDARYRVRPGDRLGDLAESYGVTLAELARVNDLEPPYLIRIDEELWIPAHAPGAARAPTAVASRTVRSQQIAAREPPPEPAPHDGDRVAPGPQQVAALELPPPAELPLAAEPPAPELKPADWAAVEPAAGPAAGPGPDAERYTVRSGETLSRIALRHDVGLSALAQANGIGKPYRVYAGQKLRIPQGEAPSTATVALGQDRGSVRLATGEPPPLRGDDFLWPVNGKVIGAFGPIDQWRRRDGIDIAARRGAPVLAAQDGIVAYAGDGIPGYGQMILLRHDQGYITTYAHNATLLVEVGDVVERGQVIARVGDTGGAAQSMLHFELRKGRTPIDPQTRLVQATTNLASSAESRSIE